MGVKASGIIAQARSYLGVKESPANSNNVVFNTDYYGQAVSGSAYSWCCAFVWDIFRMAGAPELFYGGAATASCTTLMTYGQAHGLSVDKSELQPGDLAFYNWEGGTSTAEHIGIVEQNNGDGTITAIEGNTAIGNDSNGGEVMERTRSLSCVICGYRPAYDPEEVTNVPDTTGNTPSDWAASAVAKAKAKSILKGDENGNLHLQDPVTRESLMVILDRCGLLG